MKKGRFLFDQKHPTNCHQDALPEESPPDLIVELHQVADADDAEVPLRKAIDLILRAATAHSDVIDPCETKEEGEI